MPGTLSGVTVTGGQVPPNRRRQPTDAEQNCQPDQETAHPGPNAGRPGGAPPTSQTSALRAPDAGRSAFDLAEAPGRLRRAMAAASRRSQAEPREQRPQQPGRVPSPAPGDKSPPPAWRPGTALRVRTCPQASHSWERKTGERIRPFGAKPPGPPGFPASLPPPPPRLRRGREKGRRRVPAVRCQACAWSPGFALQPARRVVYRLPHVLGAVAEVNASATSPGALTGPRNARAPRGLDAPSVVAPVPLAGVHAETPRGSDCQRHHAERRELYHRADMQTRPGHANTGARTDHRRAGQPGRAAQSSSSSSVPSSSSSSCHGSRQAHQLARQPANHATRAAALIAGRRSTRGRRTTRRPQQRHQLHARARAAGGVHDTPRLKAQGRHHRVPLPRQQPSRPGHIRCPMRRGPRPVSW